MVKAVDKLGWRIKLFLSLLLKFVLLLIWGASIWGIYTLDGALKKTPSLKNTRNLPIHRKNILMYNLADAMFMAAYQQHFDDIVVQ